jgi:hypothetical protein
MLEQIRNKQRLIVPVVGLPGLPGTYTYDGRSFESIREQAVADARILRDAGFDGIMLQNVSDLPMVEKVSPDTIAYMTTVGADIKRELGDDVLLGVSVLKNDGAAAVAIAEAIGADFVRLKVYVGAMVAAGGIEEACVDEVLAMKAKLGSDVDLWADIHDRTGDPLGNVEIEEAVEQALSKGDADAVILSGKTFDHMTELLDRVRARFPDTYLFLGGGVKGENVRESFAHGDGAFVATCLRKGGNILGALEPDRVESFVSALKALDG